MAYSGSIGNTVFNTQTFIDHGARRAGKLAEELTSEQVLSARESLFAILQSLINIGIQYWAIQETVIGLNPDQATYTMPSGTNDVLNVLYRTLNRPTGEYSSSAGGIAAFAGDGNVETYCQQTSANGNISIFYGLNNPTYTGSIGLMPYVAGNPEDWSLTIEYSADGITWKTLQDLGSVLVEDKQWLWVNIDPGQSVPYYRVRAYDGTTLALREFYVGTLAREIPMARLNRDDYTNLPNKNFTANQPYQFWFDRTVPNPTVSLWPVPNTYYVQMVVWSSRQIMDVGDLTDDLEIPTRWYEAVLMMLSHRMSLELPGVDINRIQYLEGQAEKYLNQAEQEERDRSPIYLAPNLMPYTR